MSEEPVVYRLGHFELSDVVRCGQAMRQMGKGATSMEEVAQRIVGYLSDCCVNPETGESEIVLVRFFKTHAYSDLDDELRRAAHKRAGMESLPTDSKCLVLLGSAGIRPEWNSREQSKGHKAIPLLNEESVAMIPMMSQLIRQFGMPVTYVIQPVPELLIELDEQTYNVFHVEEALESPYIPRQEEFVKPFGVRSVLGFGGMLPSGNLFAVIVFAKNHIPRSESEAFRTIALSVKTAILPFVDHAVFNSHRTAGDGFTTFEPPSASGQLAMFRSKAATLEELGNAYDRMVIEQSGHLENAVRNLGASNRDLAQEIENRIRGEAEREKLHQQLMIESRRAGMAEIATGVLHNVGNVLNSVNVSACVAVERIQRSKVKQLAQAVELIERHHHNLAEFFATDAKGQQLPGFLRLLATHLLEEQADVLKELRTLVDKVEHIKSIVATQQAFAGGSGVMEDISVATAMDEAAAIHSESFNRHRITVVREYAELPFIVVDKHKLMQIVVNLIKNGIDALSSSALPKRIMTLRTAITQDQIQIVIADNGVGIAPDDLTRIFSYGFTTKKRGHGFGLHSCANAAKEMGGSLSVQSDGLGKGSAFTLDLPFIRSIRQ